MMGEVVRGGCCECILYLVLWEWCLQSVCVVLDPTVSSASRNTHGLLPLVLCSVLCTCVNLCCQMEKADARRTPRVDASYIHKPSVRRQSDVCCMYGTELCLLLPLVTSAQLLLLLLLLDVFVLCDSGFGITYIIYSTYLFTLLEILILPLYA